MSTQIKILNPIEILDWDQRVQQFEDYSFFHSKNWANVINRTYGYKPFYFTLWRHDKLCAVFPLFEVSIPFLGKRAVSLPFTDHCIPLVSKSSDFKTLFDSAVIYGRNKKWQKIKLKGGQNFLEDAPTFDNFNLHVLKLEQDEKKLMKGFRSSTRRNIKKAYQKKLRVQIDNSLASLNDFYRLNCITRKHHGVPPQPFGFFLNIHKYILSKKNGIIIIVYHQKTAIAGAMFFHFGRKAMYKYGASRRETLGIRPNNLVMWEAIKWYSKNGYSYFDMGRSEPDNIGLNQFKNGWGTKVKQLGYYTFDLADEQFNGQKKSLLFNSSRILRKMPIPALRFVGEIAYKHMG